MRSYSFSRLLDLVDSYLLSSRRRSGETKNGTAKAAAPRLSRRRDLFLAFVIVSLPLLVIAILLLVFAIHFREDLASYVEISSLPVQVYPTDAFYTTVDPGNFLLVGSWASNIAAIIVAPFMVLFSYAVAREIIQYEKNGHEDPGSRPLLLREIMRGAHVGVWHWVGQNVFKKSKGRGEKGPLLRVVDVAGIGLFVATLLAWVDLNFPSLIFAKSWIVSWSLSGVSREACCRRRGR